MAKEFDGDADKMRSATEAALRQILHVDFDSWNAIERSAFSNFAVTLSLVPEVKRWSSAQQRSLVEIIRAKADPDESAYLRLLQQHARLRTAMLNLGSTQERPNGS
jgi:hypothetical protein